MKKTIAILLILISSLSYSQRNPANFRYGVKTNKIEFTRLTNAEIAAIIDPEEGTHVYSSTDNELKVFKNGFWVSAIPQDSGSTQGLESVLTNNSDLTTNHEIGLNGNELKISSNPNTFFKINSDSLKLSSLDNINIVSGNLGWIDVSGNVSLYNSNRLNLYGSEAFSSIFPPPPARGFSILFDNLSFGQFIELRLPNQPGTLVTEDYVTNAVSGISGLESYTEGFDEDGFYNLVIKDPNNANAARIEVIGEDGSIFFKGGVLLSASEAEFQAGRYFRYNYSNLTSGRTHNAPDANGTYTLSVAGVAADANGNVPLTLNDLGGSSNSGHTIQFNGVDSPTQPNLNFKGAVTVEDNALNNSVDVTFEISGGLSPNNTVDSFTATGGETQYTLSNTPAPSASNQLFIGRMLQTEGVDYTVSNNIITFTGVNNPLASGDEVQYFYNIEGTGAINASDITVDATGFNGNLATTDDDMQKVAQKVDDLIASGGSSIDWQGAWVSQNYTVDQAVSYQGSSYICIANTVSNEVPTNTTYWDVLAQQGNDGAAGANGLDGLNAGLRYADLIVEHNETFDYRVVLDFTDQTIAFSNFNHRVRLNNAQTKRYEGGTTTLDFSGLATQNFWDFYLYYQESTDSFHIGQRSGGSTNGDAYDPSNTDHYLITSWRGSTNQRLSYNQASIKVINTGVDYIEKLTILGDSHTNGGATWVNETMRNHGKISEAVRLGFNGSLIADVFSNSFYDRRTQIAADTELLIIFGGTNDFVNSATVGTVQDGGTYDLTTTVGSLQEIVEYAYSINPTIQIMLITPVHHFTATSGGTQYDVSAYTNGIKSVSEYYNLPLLDLDAVMNINRYNYTNFFGDAIHLNEASRIKVGRIVSQFIKSNF